MSERSPTMIIPRGADIQVDDHGQLSIKTPGNLVIQNSGNYRTLESEHGSIRIEPEAAVEAVEVRCASTCYIEGSLTAWRVAAKEIHLEDAARANIVLQEAGRLEIGSGARLVGNFESEKELFVLLSRFARQIRSLPLFGQFAAEPTRELAGEPLEARLAAPAEPAAANGEGADPLFFALVLLEREFARSAYGPASQRALEELIKLLREPDVETLALTYRGLFHRVVDPGPDVRRAFELVRGAVRR
ncbi:MAG: hypothetical protein ACRD0X_05550 [Thermoanaerobaculia bacterium]